MMRRYWIGSFVIALVGISAYFFYDHAVNAAPVDDFATWPPDTASLQREMSTPEAGVSTDTDATRKDHFAHLFQSRFRDHEPRMAVGLRFMPDNQIKLMCPARMEPWTMDRVAMLAWKETQVTFQHKFDVDIYETFIGAAPLKIGQLRPLEGHPETAHIIYLHTTKKVTQRTKVRHSSDARFIRGMSLFPFRLPGPHATR